MYEISNLSDFHFNTNTHLANVVLTQFTAVDIQGGKSIPAGRFFRETWYKKEPGCQFEVRLQSKPASQHSNTFWLLTSHFYSK